MPYSARKTWQDRAKIIYYCSFSASTDCNSQLVFSQFTNFNSNHYFFNIQDSSLAHSNHPLNLVFVNAHRNCYPDSD